MGMEKKLNFSVCAEQTYKVNVYTVYHINWDKLLAIFII